MNLSDSFKDGRYGWQWANWKLSGRSPAGSDLNLYLATAQDRSYLTEVSVRLKKDGRAGMLLFYDEQAFAGVIADKSGLTVWRNASESETMDNRFGRRFRIKIFNYNNRVQIAVRRPLARRWTVIASDIDVSGMHHNNYAGFYALRIGLASDAAFPCCFRDFTYRKYYPSR